ncbi:MAG TPA: mycofactocin precursor MftA [Streptosporangiaceae bacterium]|nr:mycofactocin precursor MftA [Streptosporangiaceae bacterium]
MSEHVATAEAATDMTEAAAAQVPGAEIAGGSAAEPEQQVALQDLLVEEVSIDGMCGVY